MCYTNMQRIKIVHNFDNSQFDWLALGKVVFVCYRNKKIIVYMNFFPNVTAQTLMHRIGGRHLPTR